jgi:predicted transcriptional regulator
MIEPGLYDRVERIADRRGCTRSEVVNRALEEYIQREILQSDESHVAGILARTIEEALVKTGNRWGTLMVRNGLESLRLEYVLFNFLVEAGIPTGKVEKWRTDGWKYAVQEYKRRRAEGEEDDED